MVSGRRCVRFGVLTCVCRLKAGLQDYEQPVYILSIQWRGCTPAQSIWWFLQWSHVYPWYLHSLIRLLVRREDGIILETVRGLNTSIVEMANTVATSKTNTAKVAKSAQDVVGILLELSTRVNDLESHLQLVPVLSSVRTVIRERDAALKE